MRREWRAFRGLVLRFAIAYAILILPWPPVRQIYGSCYRVIARICFAQFHAATVEFKAAAGENDTQLTMQPQGSPRVAHLNLDSRRDGWRATAFMLALVCASPVPRARRLRALGWGLLASQAFAAARIGCTLGLLFAPLVTSGAPAPAWAVLGSRVLRSDVAVPVLLWILVTFRAQDWQALRARVPGA